jgi:hypothetical protein
VSLKQQRYVYCNFKFKHYHFISATFVNSKPEFAEIYYSELYLMSYINSRDADTCLRPSTYLFFVLLESYQLRMTGKSEVALKIHFTEQS